MIKIPQKLTLKEVRILFDKRGLTLCDTEYINTKTYMSCYDEDGYYYYLTVDNIKDNRTKKFNIVSKQNIYAIRNIQQYIYNHGHITQLLSTEYKDIHTKLKLRCECGNIFYLNWSHISTLGKCVCNKCAYHYISETQRTTVEELEKEVSKYNYTLIDGVEQKSKDLTVKDSKGNIFHTNIYVFRNGGLPSVASGLEKKVELYLDCKNIKYTKQKTFKGCKYKSLLRFDFYLPQYKYCIECDGIQHFEPIDYYGGYEAFKIQKIKDNIKNKYCLDNNIGLSRIGYNQFKDDTYQNFINKIIE